MEYYSWACFLSVVLTSRCVGKFCHLARPSVSRDIKFYSSSRNKYIRQETHTVIIYSIFIEHIQIYIRYRILLAQ